MERAMAEGVPYVILDGKVFASDRCSEPLTSVKGKQIDAWYSGRAHHHGGNCQAVMHPGGLPLWIGPVEPGSVHDFTAARWHALPVLYRAAALGLPTLADSGYEGFGIGVLTPVRKPSGNQEIGPCGGAAFGGRVDSGLVQDLPDGGGGHLYPEHQQFAVYPAVSPPGILAD